MGAFLFGLMLGMVAMLALEITGLYLFLRGNRVSVAHVLHACALALAGRPRPKPQVGPAAPPANHAPARPNLLARDGKAKGGGGQ
jgi:hypothetical protein